MHFNHIYVCVYIYITFIYIIKNQIYAFKMYLAFNMYLHLKLLSGRGFS